MATRSIISVVATEGYLTETGSSIRIDDNGVTWFGRYCHWDGYPEHMVPVLGKIVRRFGIAGAKTRIMARGWSTLGTCNQGQYIDFTKLGDNEPIGKSSHDNDPFLIEGGDNWGTEFRYLIQDNGILEVYEVGEKQYIDRYNLATMEKIQPALDGAALSILRVVQ